MIVSEIIFNIVPVPTIYRWLTDSESVITHKLIYLKGAMATGVLHHAKK